MREALLDAAPFDWSRISPAVFGSLFQGVMDKKARRNLGAHYTSETNILKVIRAPSSSTTCGPNSTHPPPAHAGARSDRSFHKKRLASLNFLDPACGCGNFLVIAYRELRRLELEVLRELHGTGHRLPRRRRADLCVDVDQFHGIEIEEWPARIAEVALWLTDHQMNMQVSEEFGQYFVRLPLKKAPHIVHGNALACST
jgi:hypothetical protein